MLINAAQLQTADTTRLQNAVLRRKSLLMGKSLTVSSFIVGFLRRLGVQTIFGIGGANIENICQECASAEINLIIAKHEYSAATMAQGYFQRSGELGVVLTTSGGGAFNIIAPLLEAKAARIPLLCFVGQIPQELESRGGFQDSSGGPNGIDAEKIFAPISVYCQKIRNAGQVKDILEKAAEAAFINQGPAVVLLPKDIQTMEMVSFDGEIEGNRRLAISAPDSQSLNRLRQKAESMDQPPLIILGPDYLVEHPRDLLDSFIAKTSARVAVTPDAKGAFEHDDPRFVGIVGVMGHSSAVAFLAKTSTCVVLGSNLPLMARFGLDPHLDGKTIISCNHLPSYLRHDRGSTITEVVGAIAPSLELLRDAVPEIIPTDFSRSIEFTGLDSVDTTFGSDQSSLLKMPDVIAIFEKYRSPDTDTFVDSGNTGAWFLHGLKTSGRGIFNVALEMGGMGHSFGAAIGSAAASGRQTHVIAGDGSFYMHGLEIHTAIEYDLPVVFFVFNNNGHGMCQTRENVFFKNVTRQNQFQPAWLGRGMKAMFPSLAAFDVITLGDWENALRQIEGSLKPAFISVNVSIDEMPPFWSFSGQKR